MTGADVVYAFIIPSLFIIIYSIIIAKRIRKTNQETGMGFWERVRVRFFLLLALATQLITALLSLLWIPIAFILTVFKLLWVALLTLISKVSRTKAGQDIRSAIKGKYDPFE